MKADNISLTEFLGHNKVLFEIPVYQRNYEWGEKQCKQLFKDLEKIAKTPNLNHFIGALVYVEQTGPRDSRYKIIIDGQQRLTSIMLLLKAISSVCPDIREEIYESYLTNKYIEENDHIKLKPVDKDNDAFRSVISDNAINFSGLSKVMDNYKLFKSLVTDSNLTGEQLYEGLSRFNLVYIQLDGNEKGENPQVIFESLNATGTSLSDADLIRNFILMGQDFEKQNRLYHDYWAKIQRLLNANIFSEFVRCYLIMKLGKRVKREAVYSTYKDFFNTNDFIADDALFDLYQNAIFYDGLINSREEILTPRLCKIVSHINDMDKFVVYPYLMKLLELENKEKIEMDDVEDFASVLENYLIRRTICKIPSNDLNGIVPALVSTADSEEAPKLFFSKLKDKFPNNNDLRSAMLNNKIYKKGKAAKIPKLILETIEEYNNKEVIGFDEIQIEHILPQTLSSDWKIDVNGAESIKETYGDTIGNLTLTKYNPELSNKSFNDKKDFYSQSNISITRNISKYYEKWGKAEILDRANKLINSFIYIYPYPDEMNLDYKNDISGEHVITEDIDITGAKPISITIQSHEIPAKSWAICLVRFLDYIWDNDSESFKSLKNDDSASKKIFVSESQARNPKVLRNGEVVETNFSAVAIVAWITKFSEMLGIEDEVSYTIK